MKARILTGLVLLALAAVPGFAGMLVIPGVGNTPGANGSVWQTEMAVHNASQHTVEVKVRLYDGTKMAADAALAIAARGNKVSLNTLMTHFNYVGGGALVIEGNDADLRALAVTARVYNTSASGDYGQDVPALDVDDALRPGDIGTIIGPSFPENGRFNFGIFAVEPATVKWQLVNFLGVVQAERTVSYVEHEHRQYNDGVTNFFGKSLSPTDVVYARVQTGRVFVYGSIVNQTGDPTYVPGTRTRDNLHLLFVGVDIDENGTIDLRDEDMDGVLDHPLVIKTSLFPYYFRAEVVGDYTESMKYEVVSAPTLTQVLDVDNGIFVIAAPGNMIGKSGEIVFKATSQETFGLFRIPVTFF